MNLSKYCIDHGSKIAIKAFIENISPEVLLDLKKYSKKGKETTELALQFGSLSYDILEAFVLDCVKNKIGPAQVKITKLKKR